MEYASKGLGVTGATLGGVALGTSLLGGGNLLGALLGGGYNNACSDNMPVNRYELKMSNELAAKDAKISLLESTIYVDGKLNDLRNYVDCKFSAVNDKLSAQAVHNATSDALLGCVQGQIQQLYSLTKLVVPNTSVCPGWGSVTITPEATTTTTA